MLTDNKSSLLGLKWAVVKRPKGLPQIRFRLNGKQVAISTGTSAELPRKELEAIIGRWFESRRKRWVAPSRSGDFDLEIERFITFQLEGKAPRTVNEARRLLEGFREALGVHSVHAVTKGLCEAHRARILGDRPARYRKALLTVARRFCRWEVEEGNMAEFPLGNFKNPSRAEFPVRTKIWTDERFDLTLRHLRPDDRETLLVIRWTGMDPADLHGLESRHLVRVPFLKIHKVRAKAKTSAEVVDQPVSSKIKAIIEKRLAAGARLWPGDRRPESFATKLLDRVKTAQRRAGFTDTLDIKSLRHTFATYHAKRYLEGQGGPPMEVLRKWMGHTSQSRVLEGVYVHAETTSLFMD